MDAVERGSRSFADALLRDGYSRVSLPRPVSEGVVILARSGFAPEALSVVTLTEIDEDRPSVVVFDGVIFGHITLKVGGSGNLVRLGEGCGVNSLDLVCTDGSAIDVGHGTMFAGGAEIQARNGGSVEVGTDNLFAWGVRLHTDDMHEIYELSSGRPVNGFGEDLKTGSHVWFGLESLVIGGVHVGSGSIVGARSVVTRSIPSNAVAVGAPARVVRTGVSWRAIDSRSRVDEA